MAESILLVENPATGIKPQLEQLGYQVHIGAVTADQAVSLARELAPDVIVVNTMLGDVVDSGIDAATMIRGFSDVPIIFLASTLSDRSIARGRLTFPSGFLVMPFDVSQVHITIQMALSSHQADTRVRKNKERFELALAASNDGVWDWNLTTDEMYYSSRWKAMLGLQENEVGPSLGEWIKRIHPDDQQQFQTDLTAHINGLSLRLEREYRVKHADGRTLWMLMRGLVLREKNGGALRMTGTQTDITERKMAEERLAYDALHDALTGLPNRVLFMDRLAFRLERTKRYPTELFAVLFIDLDRFKIVNDSLGHSTGDQLLNTTAMRIQQCLRPEDTFSRFSGDEFVVLLNEVHDVSDAVRVAERIRGRLLTTTLLGAVERSPTASIGIAMFHNNYEKPEEILRDADLAMYRAKVLGRNRHQIFDSTMFAGAVALMQMEGELKRAVSRKEWQVMYQPVVSLKTNEVIGMEALLRWDHPERGLVFPLEFISVAEDTGYIIPIGEYILRTACQQLKEWRDAGRTDLWVAVNISARQFQAENLVGTVAKILAETGLKSGGLHLEVTESVAMKDLDYSIRVLKELEKLGVFASLDDFGTGYSSLSYLKRFPLKVLKIDQSFIQDIQNNKNSEAITMAVIAMARSLNLEVIAEGVEKVEQLDFLRSLACDYVQGFYFSQPMPAADVWDEVEKNRRNKRRFPSFR